MRFILTLLTIAVGAASAVAIAMEETSSYEKDISTCSLAEIMLNYDN